MPTRSGVTVRGSTSTHNRSSVNLAEEAVAGNIGGLWIDVGSLELENSTFHDNQPTGLKSRRQRNDHERHVRAQPPGGAFTIRNSLFVETSCSSPRDGGGSLQWPVGNPCVTDVAFGDPEIGDLEDDGGPTPTVLPNANGVAFDVGTACPTSDQRGEPRDTDHCAAGAVEP